MMNVRWTDPDPKEEGDLERVLEEDEVNQVEDQVGAVEPKQLVGKPHGCFGIPRSFGGLRR